VPTINLTARTVESLKPPPPKQQIDYWDDSLPGFGVRVSYSGTKTWVVMYRYNGRLRRLTFAKVAELDLADARKTARKKLNSVDDGHDPAADKAAARTVKTFADLADQYLERHAKPLKKSWRQDERMIKQELLSRWKHVKPADIRRPDVRAVIEAIVDRGAPIHANRMLALIRKIFNFAIGCEWVEQNPCNQVKAMGKEVSRDRVLTDDEMRRVWAALDAEEPPIQATFRLRLMTAQRGGEVLQMRWDDLDLTEKEGWWSMPASRVKNGRPHRVFLTTDAVAILNDLRAWYERRIAEINVGRAKKHEEPKVMSELVFPSPRGAEPMAWIQKAAKRIREASGVEFRPHDLRRTAASLMTGSGTPRDVVKKILNHVDRDITAVYDRYSYDAEKQKALTKWGQQLQRILEGKSTKAVLPFPSSMAV
jgi:integrase